MISKYYKNINTQFKNSINCFGLFDNRVIEGAVVKTKKLNYANIGFKYLLKITKNNSLKDIINVKTILLETPFHDMLINHLDVKKNLRRFVIWSILIKAFKRNCFIKGKVLNTVYGGLAIGLYGFVGFLPKKMYLTNKKNTDSIFWISKIDYLKKTMILSQKNINNVVSKILFKLSSKIIYMSKN